MSSFTNWSTSMPSFPTTETAFSPGRATSSWENNDSNMAGLPHPAQPGSQMNYPLLPHGLLNVLRAHRGAFRRLTRHAHEEPGDPLSNLGVLRIFDEYPLVDFHRLLRIPLPLVQLGQCDRAEGGG